MTRDARLRCIKCGTFSGGLPLCDECMEKILEMEAARRRRMSIMFTLIVILGILAYYTIL